MLPELETPVSKELLNSTIPARLAFVGRSGQPHVTPIWFLWRDGHIIMASPSTAAKVRAITRNPRVALTIDSEVPPYRVLRIRGTAEIEQVSGIADEYVECALRYYGEELGVRWLAGFRAMNMDMARIIVTPEWAESADFAERFAHLYHSDS